ncbi:MAG: alpha,alpha-trehalose-phosphate synthase (UDP-forming) [Actinomycetota bacterium]
MIVVSHRGPFRFVRQDDGTFTARRGAGGVAGALGPLLDETPDVTWIAAAISRDDVAATHAGTAAGPGVEVQLLDLDPALHRMHYDVVSNGVLWFVFHEMFDRVRRPQFDLRFREAWDAYVAVNEVFADATAKVAAEREIVLVQDFQLALLPGLLRDKRPDLRIVHFTHTPFCSADGLRLLPTDVAESLCRSLVGGPAGFHTARWARAYRAAARDALGRRAAIAPPFVASLGPNLDALSDAADRPETRAAYDALSDIVGDRMVVLRSDRIEPSKNVVRGFWAFDRLLEARPGLRERTVFVAMLYPSRQHRPEYLAYANEIDQAVAHVNERWSTSDWQPIVLDERDDYERSLAGMQRYDVLFVNPIRDGLNLVAKEGPILNRRDGLLCLSREAGAYEELGPAAFALHPFDIEQMAVALDDALAVPLDERNLRATRLRQLAAARTSTDWLRDLIAHAP